MSTAPQGARPPIHVALATCAELPLLDEDSALIVPALQARGVQASAAIWSDPTIDWSRFDLVMVRSCWDYHSQRDAFVSWTERVPRLSNTAAAVRWNTDKRYLRELKAAGITIVPTDWVEEGVKWRNAPSAGEWVVKPAVSASAVDTHRFRMEDRTEHSAALDHVRKLRSANRVVMLQPYCHEIDTNGETSMVYFDGVFSHAVRKDPVLSAAGSELDDDERRLLPGCGLGVRACEPTVAQLALSERVLASLPAGIGAPLYARIDLVPGADGSPLLMELELTEPELFVRLSPGSPERLARSLERRAHETQ